MLDRYYGDTRFYPTTDDKGYLGMNYNYWHLLYSTTGYIDNIHYIHLYSHSDEKVKKNIKPLENSLENILKLKPCRYDFDFSDSESEHLQQIDPNEYTNQFGFIAQELMEVYPDLVKFDTTTQLLGIDYIGLIAILTAALQEQDVKIKKLDEKMKAGAGENKNADNDSDLSENSALLGKNRPNPFNQNTTIEYYLPSTIKSATFYVYDLQGKQLKSIQVTERNYGYITIYGNEFQPGMYHYSLVADGQIVGIEKMILTD